MDYNLLNQIVSDAKWTRRALHLALESSSQVWVTIPTSVSFFLNPDMATDNKEITANFHYILWSFFSL